MGGWAQWFNRFVCGGGQGDLISSWVSHSGATVSDDDNNDKGLVRGGMRHEAFHHIFRSTEFIFSLTKFSCLPKHNQECKIFSQISLQLNKTQPKIQSHQI